MSDKTYSMGGSFQMGGQPRKPLKPAQMLRQGPTSIAPDGWPRRKPVTVRS